MLHDGMMFDRKCSNRLTPSIHVTGEWDIDAGNYVRIMNLPARMGLEVNNLVWELKSAGLWPKIKSLYPFAFCDFVGGAGVVRDLINLQNSGSIVGGWILSKTGAKANGTNAAINTGFSPSARLSAFNHHLAFYSRTQNTNSGYYMGANTNFNTNPRISLYFQSPDSLMGFSHGSSMTVSAGGSSTGFLIVNRTANNSMKIFRNGSQVGATNTTTVSGSYPSTSVAIGAVSTGAINSYAAYTDKECAFASMGDAFTDAEVVVFNDIVQRYQTRLNRKV